MDDEQIRIAALRKILRERDDLLLKRLDIHNRINAVMAEDRAVERKLEDLRAAGRVFGQPLAIPRSPEAFVDVGALQAAMRELRNGKDWVPGESEPVTKQEITDSLDGSKAETAEVDVLSKDVVDAHKPTIKDLVRDYVKSHHQGVKADEIRKWLALEYGIHTHEKTVGMTLYRLSKEDLVRREGHTWFSVTGSPETENPGVGAPGQTSEIIITGGTDGA